MKAKLKLSQTWPGWVWSIAFLDYWLVSKHERDPSSPIVANYPRVVVKVPTRCPSKPLPPSLLNDWPFISKAYNRSTTGLLSAVSHVSAIYYPGTLYTGHCTPPRGPRAWHSACESDSAAVTSIMIAGGIERERGREGGSQIYPVNKVPAIFQTSSAFCYWEKWDHRAFGGGNLHWLRRGAEGGLFPSMSLCYANEGRRRGGGGEGGGKRIENKSGNRKS